MWRPLRPLGFAAVNASLPLAAGDTARARWCSAPISSFKDINPYGLAQQPALYANVYGLLYNLAIYPFARCFGSSFLVHIDGFRLV